MIKMGKISIIIACILIVIVGLSLIYTSSNKINPSMTSFSVKFTTICVDADKADEYINEQNCVKTDEISCKEDEIGLKCGN